MSWTFDAELWAQGDGPDAWVFATLPDPLGEEVRDLAGPRHGFGAVRVEVTLGPTTWRTSIFPGKAGWALPVKRAVRRAADVEAGDTATIELRLV
jgi:hypothetical protein